MGLTDRSEQLSFREEFYPSAEPKIKKKTEEIKEEKGGDLNETIDTEQLESSEVIEEAGPIELK